MPQPKKHQTVIFFNILGDSLAIALSFLSAYLLRFISGIIPIQDQPPISEYAKSLLVIIPVYLWFFRAYGLYKPGRHIRRIEEIFLVAKAVTFAIVTLMAITFLYRGLSFSRIYLGALWFLSIGLISMSRYAVIDIEYRRKVQKKDMTRVLLIGATRNARTIIQWAKFNPHYGHEVVGVLARDAELTGKHVEGIEVIGRIEEWEYFMDKLKPSSVILLDPAYPRDRITDLVVACEDASIDFKVAADIYGLMTRNVAIENITSLPLLGFRSLPLDDFWNRLVKRLFDLSVSSLLLLVTFPLWIVIMIWIKIDDRGPVFYNQERVGRDGRVFKVIKFRTMKVDAEQGTGPVWAKPNDNRRTGSGDFLRRWNLDELPQFLNVFKGQMSLVGPRPERPHFVNQFRETVPRYMARHRIKSGLTGWAQVNGYRGNTSIQERIKYDLYYMENWSLLLDIEILIMTFSAFKNAY
ncbi:MAG: undecaprenyl-phosphate glucose phosphotransferase [Candidatus Omnitrophica bacterium]|nr:undecaprenyl-phosphate glucose phosphotransferase [Candidatus Omnitrophota bacterium]